MTIVSACVFGFPDALGSVAIAMNDVVITMTAAVMSAATGIIARNISFVPQLETLKYQLGRVFAEDARSLGNVLSIGAGEPVKGDRVLLPPQAWAGEPSEEG
jgi:hypothetical protein